jgi:hypothetical protein
MKALDDELEMKPMKKNFSYQTKISILKYDPFAPYPDASE